MFRVPSLKKRVSGRRKKTDKADKKPGAFFQFTVLIIFIIALSTNGIWKSFANSVTSIDQEPQILDPIAPLPPEPENRSIRLIGNPLNYLNVRSGPGTNYKLLRQIFDEGSYEYTTIEDGWYRIILDNGSAGWIYGNYVENDAE